MGFTHLHVASGYSARYGASHPGTWSGGRPSEAWSQLTASRISTVPLPAVSRAGFS